MGPHHLVAFRYPGKAFEFLKLPNTLVLWLRGKLQQKATAATASSASWLRKNTVFLTQAYGWMGKYSKRVRERLENRFELAKVVVLCDEEAQKLDPECVP